MILNNENGDAWDDEADERVAGPRERDIRWLYGPEAIRWAADRLRDRFGDSGNIGALLPLIDAMAARLEDERTTDDMNLDRGIPDYVADEVAA